ncbi:hypothetical protein H0H92_012900 [Tricholoma furcatifolium]|nr:hypothetical protein H0H92_012900 [Tricholoma furcatifolium]
MRCCQCGRESNDWQIQAEQVTADATVRQEQNLWQEAEDQVRHKTETAQAKERKKKRTKYLELSEAPSPITPPEILPTYATLQLQKGQYVELWYFINEGIASGLKHAFTVDKKTMAQSIDKDGTVTWISAITAKVLREAKADRDLSWEQVLVAFPRFIEAIHATEWPEQHQKMITNDNKPFYVHLSPPVSLHFGRARLVHTFALSM